MALAAKGSSNPWPVIGISLGTTYSCVGVYINGQGDRITPSWNKAHINPERTLFDIQRLIGREFNDMEVQREIKLLPYKVVNIDGKPYIQVKFRGETKVFSPEEISAMILTKMKETAEASLFGEEDQRRSHNCSRRNATKDAGKIAGLNVVQEEKNIYIGGGTFDVSILTIDDGVIEVISTSGDTHLGGEDFNHRVMEYLIKLIKKQYNRDISKDNKAIWKLHKECERAKRALYFPHQFSVGIESPFDGIDFSESLTRERFEELNMDLFNKTMRIVEKTLQDTGLKKKDIHEIVLVGGSTKIPKVKQLLMDLFNGKEPMKGLNPDEVAAYGASIHGGVLSGEADYDTHVYCDCHKYLKTVVS
ncbi:putative Heat shock protein 70 family [Rosa chinensis]|uniref:Putative Heat shock protein 70 family n=1 Tax=Rosa chinensis TaxID=74649 RepID=A0A2P6R740_ROSCH|nr:putative Heat shock protein 70 family [Rosa chinensis]